MNSASQTPHHRAKGEDDDGPDADTDDPDASLEFRPPDPPGCLAVAAATDADADDNGSDGDIPRVILPWGGRRRLLLSGEPVTDPARPDSSPPNLR